MGYSLRRALALWASRSGLSGFFAILPPYRMQTARAAGIVPLALLVQEHGIPPYDIISMIVARSVRRGGLLVPAGARRMMRAVDGS